MGFENVTNNRSKNSIKILKKFGLYVLGMGCKVV